MAKQECVLKFKEGSQEPRKVTLDGLVESELPPIAAGDAGKVLTVKSDESGVEYKEAQGGSLPEGGNNGDVLTKDSSVAAGAKWAAPQGGVVVTITVHVDAEARELVVDYADKTPIEVYNLLCTGLSGVVKFALTEAPDEYTYLSLVLGQWNSAQEIKYCVYAMNHHFVTDSQGSRVISNAIFCGTAEEGSNWFSPTEL